MKSTAPFRADQWTIRSSISVFVERILKKKIKIYVNRIGNLSNMYMNRIFKIVCIFIECIFASIIEIAEISNSLHKSKIKRIFRNVNTTGEYFFSIHQWIVIIFVFTFLWWWFFPHSSLIYFNIQYTWSRKLVFNVRGMNIILKSRVLAFHL